MEKILISACFLGANVRYDAIPKPYHHRKLSQWRDQGRLISICPEVSGGLSTPRPAAEYQASSDLVIDIEGNDVTDAFKRGANLTLALCIKHNIKFAMLKEFSPSCGSQQIYDGSFSSMKINGQGITAKLLVKNGVRVYSELMIEQLIEAIEEEN